MLKLALVKARRADLWNFDEIWTIKQ